MSHDPGIDQFDNTQNTPGTQKDGPLKTRNRTGAGSAAEAGGTAYCRHLEALLAQRTAELATVTQQLHHAQKMEAVGTLAGGIAHDFNNILQTISGYTQILLEEKGAEDPDLDKLIAVDKAAHRAGDLIKRLLVFSRKMESNLKPLDLNREVAETVKLLSRTIQKMIQIELCLDEGIRAINADPVQVEQIIMNLVINARDAMPEGGKLPLGQKTCC